jgi:hypothetical protein
MHSSALNVMAGDFNFVESNGDRFRGNTHEFTGRHDRPEAKEFKRLITDKFDLAEIEQCMHTRVWGKPNKGLHSTSRLDRVYSSAAVGWAHLQESFCDMLPWKCSSDHYPVRFGARKIIYKRDPLVPVLPLWVVNHKLVPERVNKAFEKIDWEGIDNGPVERPWTRLNRLKVAFRHAAATIEEEFREEKLKIKMHY